MGAFLETLLALLAIVFFQAALMGTLLVKYTTLRREHKALQAGQRQQRVIVVPEGYRPELDIMPPQNQDLVFIFMKTEDYERMKDKRLKQMGV